MFSRAFGSEEGTSSGLSAERLRALVEQKYAASAPVPSLDLRSRGLKTADLSQLQSAWPPGMQELLLVSVVRWRRVRACLCASVLVGVKKMFWLCFLNLLKFHLQDNNSILTFSALNLPSCLTILKLVRRLLAALLVRLNTYLTPPLQPYNRIVRFESWKFPSSLQILELVRYVCAPQRVIFFHSSVLRTTTICLPSPFPASTFPI